MKTWFEAHEYDAHGHSLGASYVDGAGAVHVPALDAASSSSSELPSSASLHEGAVSGLKVLGLEYGVKLAGEQEEDAEGWVQLYCLNVLGAAVPQGEMLHEKISENGKHGQDAESHNPLEGEAESEEGHFHESDDKLRLDGAVVLSRKHREVACSADMTRAKAVAVAGAGAVQPCRSHSHLLIMAELGQQQPDGQRLQPGKKRQGSRGQKQMHHGNPHFHES